MIDDHRRWLETGGKAGVQIGTESAGREDEVPPLDFSGMLLDGIDLSLGKLYGAKFRGSSLRGTCWIGSELGVAEFTDCDLSGARFDGATLDDTRFKRAVCRGVRFDRAYLTTADLSDVDYRGASFEGAILDDTIWTAEQRVAYDVKDRPEPDAPVPSRPETSSERLKERANENRRFWHSVRGKPAVPYP